MKRTGSSALTFALYTFAFLYTVFFLLDSPVAGDEATPIIERLKIQVTRTGTSFMTALVGVFSVSVLLKSRNDETLSVTRPCATTAVHVLNGTCVTVIATVFIKHD